MSASRKMNTGLAFLQAETLQTQVQKLSGKISRTEKFLQQSADAERDSQRFVEGAEQHLRVVGEQLQVQLGVFLSALQECVRAHSGAGPGAELELSRSRITEDQTRLLQAQSGLQALLQENDPFRFVQEYHSTGKKLRKALKRPLFSPGSVCLDTEALAEVMEAKLEEFQTEFRLQISDFIHTVCSWLSAGVENNRMEEDKEGREEGDEEEDKSVEDCDHEDDEDEMRSEGGEEVHHSKRADDLYNAEEEEEEEDVASD